MTACVVYSYRFDPDHPESYRRKTGKGGQRAVTCLAYLAEPTRGGRTVFPKLGVGFDPRVGGEFLFISVRAIGMTSCFVYRRGVVVEYQRERG